MLETNIFVRGNRGHQENVRYNVEGHQKKHMMDIVGTMVKIVLYYIFYSNQGSLGSMVGKTLGDVEKTPQKKSWVLKISIF
jgi:hypothetical protein